MSVFSIQNVNKYLAHFGSLTARRNHYKSNLLSCHCSIRLSLPFLQNQFLLALLVDLEKRLFYGFHYYGGPFQEQALPLLSYLLRPNLSPSSASSKARKVACSRRIAGTLWYMEMSSAEFSSLRDKLVILKIAAVLLAKVSNCTLVKLGVKSQTRFSLKLL